LTLQGGECATLLSNYGAAVSDTMQEPWRTLEFSEHILFFMFTKSCPPRSLQSWWEREHHEAGLQLSNAKAPLLSTNGGNYRVNNIPTMPKYIYTAESNNEQLWSENSRQQKVLPTIKCSLRWQWARRLHIISSKSTPVHLGRHRNSAYWRRLVHWPKCSWVGIHCVALKIM